MVEHIVLIKWKPDAPPGAIEDVMRALEALKGQVPGIVDLVCGPNFSTRSQGFQTGLIVRLTDRAALDAYGPHPAHQAVVQNLIAPIREDVIAVDFEVPDTAA